MKVRQAKWGADMDQFKLVTVQAIQPMIRATDLSVVQLAYLAERAGLPGSIIETPTGIVPLKSTESFLNLVHQRVGDPEFLFKSLGTDTAEKRET